MGGRARDGLDRARPGGGVPGPFDRLDGARDPYRTQPRAPQAAAAAAQRPDRGGAGDPAAPEANSLGLSRLLPANRPRPRYDPDADRAADLRAHSRRTLQEP